MSAIAPTSAESLRPTVGASLWRLYLMRVPYLIIAVGLGVVIWPTILHHEPEWQIMHGVGSCMLGAVAG